MPQRMVSFICCFCLVLSVLIPVPASAWVVFDGYNSDKSLEEAVESGEAFVDEQGGVWKLQTQTEDVGRHRDVYTESLKNQATFGETMAMSMVYRPQNEQYTTFSDELQIQQLSVDFGGGQGSSYTGSKNGTWDNSMGVNQTYGFMWKTYICPDCEGKSPVCNKHLTTGPFSIDGSSYAAMQAQAVYMFVMYKDSTKGGYHHWIPWKWAYGSGKGTVNTQAYGTGWTPAKQASKNGKPMWNMHDLQNGQSQQTYSPVDGYAWPTHGFVERDPVAAEKIAKKMKDGSSQGWKVNDWSAVTSEGWYPERKGGIPYNGNITEYIVVVKNDLEPDGEPEDPKQGQVESIKNAYDTAGIANFSDPVQGVKVSRSVSEHPNHGHPASNQN